jgi:hypothetical protein
MVHKSPGFANGDPSCEEIPEAIIGTKKGDGKCKIEK